MTLITKGLLWIGDLNLFDAIIYGLGAAGTGGFANKDLSIGYYNSTYTEIILAIAMLLGRLEIYPLLLLLTPSTYKRR